MRGILGIIIWVAAAAGAVWLWLNDQPASRPLPGIAGPAATTVALTEPARLLKISVSVGSVVAAGAVVAQFDTADIDAELVVAKAELAAAEAEVAAEQLRRIEGRRDAKARLLGMQAQARAAQGEARSRKAAATAEMRTLGRSVARIKEVAAEGLIRGDGLASLEGRRARLRQEARASGGVLTPWAELQASLDATLNAQASVDSDAVIDATQARAGVWRAQIAALQARRTRRALTMPFAGRIVQLLQRPGATVQAGTPVLELAEASTTMVRVWAPEQGARRWPVGMRVQVRVVDPKSSAVYGVISAISPGIVPMAERLWQNPNMPRYGRLMHVTLDAPATGPKGLLAGEAVVVRPK